MKYIRSLLVIAMISVFTVAYVWQNIEVMKMKMEYQAHLKREKQLLKEIDKYRYAIERFRRMSVVEEQARRSGYRRIGPNDIVEIEAQ